MIALVLLFAATVGTTAVVTVPPMRWQPMPIAIPAGGRVLDLEFEVSGGEAVQVLIIERTDRTRYRRGLKVEPVAATEFSDSGRIRQVMPAEGGDYLVIIDNRRNRRRAANVRISIELRDHAPRLARELPPERRRAVVAASIGFFGATVVGAAWLMLRRL